jgi:hypothetical protein
MQNFSVFNQPRQRQTIGFTQCQCAYHERLHPVHIVGHAAANQLLGTARIARTTGGRARGTCGCASCSGGRVQLGGGRRGGSGLGNIALHLTRGAPHMRNGKESGKVAITKT